MLEPGAGDNLVRKAFEMARSSGKGDWQRMTVPVLKNRILVVSGGSFREAEFGATSFRDFLALLSPGLITIDDSQSPSAVVLCGDSSDRQFISQHPKVRSDLWRAVIDYSSGKGYIWDPTAKRAKPAIEQESGTLLPTLTAKEFGEWRVAFATEHAPSITGDGSARLSRWSTESLPTNFLPAHLRPLWNAELKRRVQERLVAWFAQNNIESPTDIVSMGDGLTVEADRGNELRRFVIDCVRVMTQEELETLLIPSRAAMRARSRL